MSRRNIWSLVGVVLSVVALLSLLAQAFIGFITYPTDPPEWAVRVLSVLAVALPVGAAVALFPVAARAGRGRAAAIFALASVGVIGLGYLMIFTTPKEEGANIGAGFLLLPAYPTLLISSLLAWLAERDDTRQSS
jgi:hypothetical protein